MLSFTEIDNWNVRVNVLTFQWIMVAICAVAVSNQANASTNNCFDPTRVIEAMAELDTHGINPVVIAHRGVWQPSTASSLTIWPENSGESLLAADRACVEAVELDLKSIADGTPVVMHDFNVGGTTDYGDIVGQSLYDPLTNKGLNPTVASLSLDDFRKLHLREDRLRGASRQIPTSTVRDIYDQYYSNRMSTVLVWDIKTTADAIALAKVIDNDPRDYAHGTMPREIRAADITVFKINATVYPYGAWYVNDMMAAGISRIPKVMPIYTTNMEGDLRKKFNVSPTDSLRSWNTTSNGAFLAPEINLKQEHHLLQDIWKYAAENGMSIGVFNAIPGRIFGDSPEPPNMYPPPATLTSQTAFFWNTGQCCYQLSRLYSSWDGISDTDDERGSWSYLFGSDFGVITTDQAVGLIGTLNTKGQRSTDRYGKNSW